MRCPKCQYISFEAASRCRNCGFDLSLAAAAPDAAELPLDAPADGPPIDYALHPHPGPSGGHGPRPARHAAPHPTPGGLGDLPLFETPMPGVDDTPLIRQAGPPRPPLAVRRSPEPPQRGARPSVEPTPAPGVLEDALFRDESSAAPASRERGVRAPAASVAARSAAPSTPSGPGAMGEVAGDPVALGARAAAAAVDAGILGAIDLLVLVGTLRVTGVSALDVGRLPLAPLLAFLGLLNGGYLAGFVTAAGQTIGQMLMGHRVVTERGSRVPLGQAVARTAGVAVSVLPLGIGCLPLLVRHGSPALHDRLSRTRVVRA